MHKELLQSFEDWHTRTRRFDGALVGASVVVGPWFDWGLVGFRDSVVGFKAIVVWVCRSVARIAVRRTAGMDLKAILAYSSDLGELILTARVDSLWYCGMWRKTGGRHLGRWMRWHWCYLRSG